MDFLDMGTEDTLCEVHSGKYFDIQNPVFDITDIAHSLSKLCRFNGHTERFYSVAEHSVLVAWLLDKWEQPTTVVLQGLLHDATEAYLSDVPAPFKHLLPDWRALDKSLETKLWEHFGLGEKSPMVKKADWYALFIEANALLPSKGEWFHDPMNVRSDALLITPPCDMGGYDLDSIEYTFLMNYMRLREATQ